MLLLCLCMFLYKVEGEMSVDVWELSVNFTIATNQPGRISFFLQPKNQSVGAIEIDNVNGSLSATEFTMSTGSHIGKKSKILFNGNFTTLIYYSSQEYFSTITAYYLDKIFVHNRESPNATTYISHNNKLVRTTALYLQGSADQVLCCNSCLLQNPVSITWFMRGLELKAAVSSGICHRACIIIPWEKPYAQLNLQCFIQLGPNQKMEHNLILKSPMLLHKNGRKPKVSVVKLNVFMYSFVCLSALILQVIVLLVNLSLCIINLQPPVNV